MEESELPVRPRAVESPSSPTLKRSRPAGDDSSVKRARLELENIDDINGFSQSTVPVPVLQDVPVAPLPEQALSVPISAETPSEASRQPGSDLVSEPQAPKEPFHQSAESSLAQYHDTIILDLTYEPDSPDQKPEPDFAAQTDPSGRHLAVVNPDLGHPSTLGIPKISSNGVDVHDDKPTANLSTVKSSSTRTNVLRQNLQPIPLQVPGTAPRRRPPPASTRVLGHRKLEIPYYSPPVKISSSRARYQHTVLGRHKQTPFWGGRKPSFTSVRAT